MKVYQLIRQLQQCDPNGSVLLRTPEGGVIRAAGAWQPSNRTATIIYHNLSDEAEWEWENVPCETHVV
jgi:hypothetical protein